MEKPTYTNLPERFWAKVNFQGPIPDGVTSLGNCWIWLGKSMGFAWHGQNVKSTRLAYVDSGKDLPAKTPLNRHCWNGACVRPEHGRVGRDEEVVGDLGLPARFWEKVDKQGEDGCWEWTRSLCNGYAQFGINPWDSATVYGHILVYQRAHGNIPEGFQVDHKCWNRACINPNHLRALSHAGNQQNRKGASSNSLTGVRGVSPSGNGQKFVARGSSGGVEAYLGTFDTIEEASSVSSAWRRERHPFSLTDQLEEVAA